MDAEYSHRGGGCSLHENAPSIGKVSMKTECEHTTPFNNTKFTPTATGKVSMKA